MAVLGEAEAGVGELLFVDKHLAEGLQHAEAFADQLVSFCIIYTGWWCVDDGEFQRILSLFKGHFHRIEMYDEAATIIPIRHLKRVWYLSKDGWHGKSKGMVDH